MTDRQTSRSNDRPPTVFARSLWQSASRVVCHNRSVAGIHQSVCHIDDTQLRSEYSADARVPRTGHAGWRNNVVVRRGDQQYHRDHNQHIAADIYGGAAAHQDHTTYAQHHQQSMAAHGRDSEADVAKEESGAPGGRSALQNNFAAANAGTHNRLSSLRSMGRPPVPHWR